MAFILHLIDAPDVTTPEAAVQFIDEQRDLPPVNNPKFCTFVSDITGKYPDLSEDDDDGDNDENLWEEGIDDKASYGNVKELVVSVDIDEDTLADLIDTAVKNGLRLYDEEGEVLYPED
jgi:hypothetical protein